MHPSDPGAQALRGVLVVLLFNYQPRHKAWGWQRLVRGASAFSDVPGLRFAKVMGSGHGGGFTLRPSATHQGLMALLDDADAALNFLQDPQVQACRERSAEHWHGVMAIDSARGAWDGQAWAPTPPALLGSQGGSLEGLGRQPLAVLTRASIRPAKALSFWRHAPASQVDLLNAPGCTLAMGLGEAPFLRQCTFSVWRNTSAMLAYAQSGAHRKALDAAYRQDYFSESLFMRMRLLQHGGHWPRPGQLSESAPA